MSAAVLEHTGHFTAPASAAQIPRLRHRLAKTLADWGITQRVDDVLCSCSELLTNALIYGQTEHLAVDLAEQGGWLRLSVPDNNPMPPYPTLAGHEEEDGRGIFLVAALADAWGFRACNDGKHVFAEFRVGDHIPAHPVTMAPGDLPTTPL